MGNHLILHESGAWLRDGTYDLRVPSQLRPYKSLPMTSATVLDCGAHIGLFTRLAIQFGASCVVAVEPHPANVELFKLNTKEFINVELLQAAIVASDADTVQLYESSTDTSAHSICSTRGRTAFEVSAVNFTDLLFTVKPDVVKLDIEGGEYDLFDTILTTFANYNIKAFAIEYHFKRKHYFNDTLEFINKLHLQYTDIITPTIKYNSWNAVGVYAKR